MRDRVIFSGSSNHEKAYACGNATNEIIPNSLISKAEVKTEEKEKQIEEMARLIGDSCTIHKVYVNKHYPDRQKDMYYSLAEELLKYYQPKQQDGKEMVKEMIEEIDNVKDIFPNDIVGYEQAQGWCMCVNKLKEIAKNKGVECENA